MAASVIEDGGAGKTAGTGTNGSAGASVAKFPTLNTNKLAYRLSNTTNTLRQLQAKPHAILLANALIDTDKPLDLKIPAHLRSQGNPGAYIVQARGPIGAAFRAALAAARGGIVSYIPNNAYLVNLEAAAAGQLAGNPTVQAVLPYEPYYKLQSSLLGLAVNGEPLPPGTALTLGLFGGDPTAVAEIQALGVPIIGRDQSPFGPVVRVLAPTDWTLLAQSTAVQFLEPAFTRRPANDLSRVTLGISPDTTSPITNGYAVNGQVLTGNKVLVAVNDSGVDAAHPDFTTGGTAESGPGTGPIRVLGLTPLDLVDTNGHGTHVAGIIAGNGAMSYPPNGTNVGMYAEGSVPDADFRGKAPLATLFSVNDANYSDYQLQTNAALVGALISNNSWDYGNGDEDYDLAAASYDFATRDAVPGQTGSQPVLFVFAAGNDGGGADDGTGGSADTIVSPGTAKNVITVGALEQLRNITNIVTTIIPGTGTNAPTTNEVAYWQDQTDSSDQVAGYSSRGNVGIGTEGNNGRFKPDVVSPGTFVVSTSSQFNDEWNTNAYYNPTNVEAAVYTYQVADSNALVYFNVEVPPNAVAVSVSIYPNNFSPSPFPNLVIYCQQSGYPDPVNDPSAIDITSYDNQVLIPPGANNCTIPNLQGNGFDIAVGVTNNQTVNFNLTVDILVTNDVGNLYGVLMGMNNSLGGYYRYESGTSMAAASVSGVLALIQDYFTNQFKPAMIPSPALLKALLINGARSEGDYELEFTNGINYQGWGLEDIQTSVPEEGLFDQTNGSTTGSTFFVEQNPVTALATGDRHTFLVNLDTNTSAQGLYLQATLVWTDPPGDPAAALKLVNNLDLIVTNLDKGDVNYGAVYFGNDIQPNVGYNLPWNTNGPPNIDTINNVQNVILPPSLGGQYSVTVVGRGVNVNAVTAQTNNVAGQYAPNIVQDFALVIAVGEGEVTNAFTVADGGLVRNPTGGQNVTAVLTTNAPLSDQLVGASSPLLGTNNLGLGANTEWGTNGVLTIGQTNQWHFYVVTNNGGALDYTNAAFLIFGVSTLSIPRMGVYEDEVTNATTPEANLDLFVSQDPGLTNLDPAVISNCLAGANNSRAAVANAGTQFAFYTNSAPGQVYYIGVQSQDQMAGEYSFMPIFTDVPFSSLDQNGNQIVNGLLLPMPIPPGNNAHPGLTNIFMLAVIPMVVEQVTVTNQIVHQDFGDLFGTLAFGGSKVVLNNHDGFGNTILFPKAPIVYNDSPNHPLGTTNTDGPGSLLNYRGMSGLGPWILSELANAAGGATGEVARLTLLIQPHRNLGFPGVIISVPPGGWFYDWVDVPPGYTNLTFYGTNVTTGLPAGTPPIQMYEELGNDPTLDIYDQEATLTNGTPPGNTISVGPPLPPGRYFIGLYNDADISQTIYLSVTLGIGTTVNDIFTYTSDGSQGLPDDAVTPAPAPTGGAAPNATTAGSTIAVPDTVTNLVASVNVGIVVDSPRISDYAFTLVSPTGQRVLLMENRGGTDTNGAGLTFVYTNVINSTATGGAAANTNYLSVNPNPSGTTVPITWNFYTIPDQMTVYSTTNPADFNSGFLLYNTGFASNSPAGGGAQNTIPVTTNVFVPALVTNITIIMNQFGNPYAGDGDEWIYTAGAPSTNYEYLAFTDNTNLATVPIKFAPTPFSFRSLTTNFALSDLDLATNGNYFGPTNVNDRFNGGWLVPTNLVLSALIETNGQFVTVTNVVRLTNNLVSVVTDPSTALTGDAGGSNYLALGNGTITRSIPTIPGRIYNVTFWYRGPDIEGWWRGEGNANDSSDPENNNNNGQLIGRFDFPAGEVGQAFEFEDPGNTYQFAGTNTYVQVPASPSLNVGADGGFTVEGWINPTNLLRPQPLVEWLARVPTNTATADTNLAIVQGPVLNPATGHYYYLLASTNWITSAKWATELGGTLTTLETANEGQWVYDTFTAYGTLNRDLWIGLHDMGGTWLWADGSTSLTYTNWAPGEPGSACPGDDFVAILGPTNAYPGLWSLEGNSRETCGAPPTLPIYGVAEVATLPTNGVQVWISGTNGTGATNYLQGCLYANIVDTNYGSHVIYSAPGLLTTNVYQHVALTFNTNSGIAALYLNGTNVATSNLYTAGLSFVPKTDGDLLLGYDLSLYTNNFFGGEMDEMSVYGRALSLAEIHAIYDVSAQTTNRSIGKFNPAVTPAVGLAEALVTFGASSNVIFGVNNQWEVNSYTFLATSNSMPLTISGIAPGILLDAFEVAEAPETNLYYFPEQPLSTVNGSEAGGNWTLQVWDSRAGAYVPNVDQLVSWQLSFVLVSNALISATLPPETPVTSTVEPGQTVYYAVPVPVWAHQVINVLESSTLPVDLLYYSPANPPTTAVGPTRTLLTGRTSGSSLALSVTPVPPQTQFGTYYLGVRNNGAHAAEVVLEADFDILALANGTPFTSQLTNEYNAVRYFSFDVSSNAYESTFQLLQLSGNADLVVSKGGPLPDLNSGAYGSFNNSNADQSIYVLTNSEPVPLSAGRWYLGVLNRDGTQIQYSVLAKELDLTNLTLPTGVMPAIINLTNGVPVTWTAGPGAALTNFFHFRATNSVVNGTNVFLAGLRFELYNLSGNGDLTAQTNALPLAPPFYQTSQNGGTSPELIFVYTNNVQTNLAGDWYLGVPNREVTNISYTIVAEILTNLYFPAFPGAQGAGEGAVGAGHAGVNSTVYHVISTSDSGPGTLRDAVGATNRTVVFDIGGLIDLQSPLVITNSYLTVAGQSSPGSGITVSGDMTVVTNAHDVIIRDLRFRTVPTGAGQSLNFEGATPRDYMAGQTVASWMIATNQTSVVTSVVTDPADAYSGHNNFLALANGIISNTIATIPGKSYALALTFRGPKMLTWWRGENNAQDSVGENNGTPMNGGPAFKAGEVGEAFDFTPNEYVLVNPANSAFDVGPENGFTMDCWINPANMSQRMPIFEFERILGSSSGSDVGCEWYIDQPPGTANFEVNVVDSTGAGHQYESPGNLVSAGVWQHIALTYSKATGMLVLYQNGRNVAQSYLGNFTPLTTFPNLLIGARTYLGTPSVPVDIFVGQMDEAGFYGRALSDSEIKAIYAAGSAGKFDPAIFSSSPAQSLAEATICLPGITTNVFLGNNTNWQ
ncbi:MAG: LamG-like jellyroll fold domain-containing protein, partial [Verrucomicrobiota bacterium]